MSNSCLYPRSLNMHYVSLIWSPLNWFNLLVECKLHLGDTSGLLSIIYGIIVAIKEKGTILADELFVSRFSYIMRDYWLLTIFEKCSDSIFHNLNVLGNAFMLTHVVSPGISNSDFDIVTNI
jgi:hypothetical protein